MYFLNQHRLINTMITLNYLSLTFFPTRHRSPQAISSNSNSSLTIALFFNPNTFLKSLSSNQHNCHTLSIDAHHLPTLLDHPPLLFTGWSTSTDAYLISFLLYLYFNRAFYMNFWLYLLPISPLLHYQFAQYYTTSLPSTTLPVSCFIFLPTTTALFFNSNSNSECLLPTLHNCQ